jgi:hypothetical protein
VPSSLAAQTDRELRNTDSNCARCESLPITLGYKRFAHAADVAIPDNLAGVRPFDGWRSCWTAGTPHPPTACRALWAGRRRIFTDFACDIAHVVGRR